MSLPSSEPLPDDINDLPPARRRHIRRLPRSATPAERQILLDSLLGLTSPTLNYFLFALIGILAVGSALYLNDPALLIVAVVTLPFHIPVFGLGLLPAALKLSSGLKSIISLLIPIVLSLICGGLAGWLQKADSLELLGLHRFSAPYWLDLTIVGVSTLLGALILLRQGQLPRLTGALLTYEIIVPLAAGGFGFVTGDVQLWHGALLTGFLHLGIALFTAIFAFFLLGFCPKKTGWLMTLAPITLILAALLIGMKLDSTDITAEADSSPTPTFIVIPSRTLSPETTSFTATSVPGTPTPTRTPSQTPTVTMTLTATPTLTQTQTPEPTTYWGLVGSLTGAVVRESPDFQAAVVTYANDGDFIEILDTFTGEDGAHWFKVRTTSGVIGWLLSSLVNTPTPTATP